MPRVKEETAIVLDFLRHGYSEDSREFHRREAIIQAVGKDHFVLFELVPRAEVKVSQNDEIYIGEGERKKIKYIKGTLGYDDLTQSSKTELPHILKKLVETHSERFVKFFNNAGPISLRSHSLELLPGVGKKHTRQILEERRKSKFEDLNDFKKRVTSVSHPEKVVVDRIIAELKGKDRHRLFAGV